MREFDERLREKYVAAQDRWPALAVGYEAFARRVRRALDAGGERGLSALERCPAEDLYLAAALDGQDPRAWEAFHREQFGFIRSIARKFALNDEDAEDVAQELCANIGTRLQSYAGRGSLRGWLCAIVPNLTRDRYRSGAARFETSLEARVEANPGDEERSQDPALLTDSGVSAHEARDRIDRPRCREMFEKTLASAMERLDPEQRELIVYKYVRRLKSREIARIRGVGEYVIAKHLSKALTRLQKRILMNATTMFGFSSKEVRDCLEIIS